MSQIKKIIDRIEGLMVSYCDDYEGLYDSVIRELPSVNYSVIFTNLNTLPLYRVRLNSEDNRLFTNVKELYYAPSECVSSYGRVNNPGQSMFYCSEFSTICDLELLYDYLRKNDIGHERYATYSQWDIKQDLNLLVLAIAPSNREISNGFTLRNMCFQFVKSEPEASQKTYSDFYTLTEHFFLKNAKTNNSVYVVCSAIASHFTHLFPKIDGVIYPTVQGNTGYNIVLRPHTLDSRMITPRIEVVVRKWIITNKDTMTIAPNFERKGQIMGDEIVWE